ncbi:hypothetical protein CASFOL_014507 [Castilleja foliolosa]|uniref:F-box domain-containing protein n=1 Tax=Castilleja foliolosa TaxID=1961234 RepID=A0ABD3DNN3_9LAMI
MDPPPPHPPWIELPRCLTENILRRLGAVGILEIAQNVCNTWRSVSSEPSLWQVIDIMDEYHDFIEFYRNIFYISPTIMYRQAVDLSQGELIDINILCFVRADLLHYISERSSRLKRLRLGRCDDINIKDLTASVKKFPELEELHLFYMPDITAEDIESISISCPKLKSFTFNNRSYRSQCSEIDNSCALTIAKNMPNLQHLYLIGNRLSNEGLKAIFNGCPKIESLELRQCFNIDLRGDFGKICSERIKYLKYHSFLANDHEFDDMIYVKDHY